MRGQLNFTDIEYSERKRTTKREVFLRKMDELTLPTAEAGGFSFRWDCAVVRRHRSSYFPSASIDSGVSRPTVLLLFTQAVAVLR